jgi:hypothetical protein
MGLSSRVPSGADTYKYVPDLFSNKIVDVLKDTLVAWDAIDSSWESELKKGDVLYIPKANTVTASEVVVGTKAGALDPFATAAVTLTVNQWFEAPVDIDYMTKYQTQAQMESTAVSLASFAVKEKIDTTVCTLFSSLGGYSTSGYGSDGQTLTDDLLLAIKETLDEANVPMDGQRYLIVDPSALTDLMKIDKFIRNDYVNKGAVTNGNIGSSPIYGCNVRVTNNLVATTTGNYAVLMHKKAIGGVAQIMKAWRKEFEELHLTRYQSEALWGVIEVNDSMGVPFFTRKS